MPSRERRIIEQVADSPEWRVLCRSFVYLDGLQLNGQDPASMEMASAVKVFRRLGITPEELSTVFMEKPPAYWPLPSDDRPPPKLHHSFEVMSKCTVRVFDAGAWRALARLARRRIVVIELVGMEDDQILRGIFYPSGRWRGGS